MQEWSRLLPTKPCHQHVFLFQNTSQYIYPVRLLILQYLHSSPQHSYRHLILQIPHHPANLRFYPTLIKLQEKKKMPLQQTREAPTSLATSLPSAASTSQKASFLVVYASLTGNRSWCGDCRAAEPFLNKKFGVSEDVAKVVYAGQPAE
jgi:hypothetical protein